MKLARTLAFVLIASMGTLHPGEPAPLAYNTRVAFREKKAILFPDFTLTYLGKRQAAPPAGLRGWSFHDFTVSAGGHEQRVSWTSGTGDIGPTEFKVGAKTFLLEMGISDTLGKMKADEVVVRPKK